MLVSTTKGDTTTTFPAARETTLKASIRAHDRVWVATRLRTFSGFGERSEEVLFQAYDEVKRCNDKTVHGLDSDDRTVFTRIRNAWGAGLAQTLT